MAVEIINPNYIFHVICSRCPCHLHYNLSDVKFTKILNRAYVKCPCCGKKIYIKS